MNYYPGKISERFLGAKNTGEAIGENAVGTSAAFVCGAALRFSLRIDLPTKEVIDAKFKTNGCGFLIAAADVLAGLIKGRRLTDLHGLENSDLEAELEKTLGQFYESRSHCLELTISALHLAVADFRSFQIERFEGESPLICTCFGVTAGEVEKIAGEKQLQTVESVGAHCNAGTGCGSCRSLIQEILDDSRIANVEQRILL